MRFVGPLFALIALGAALAVGGCGEAAPPPPAQLEVPVVEVIQRDQPIVLEMVGATRGSADIPIRARVEGVLLGMHFTEGRKVAAGDLLYTIDASPFESKVVEARGDVAQARTMLAKSKADLDRIEPLAAINAVSQQDLDGAVAQYEAALGALQASEARLEQAKIELGYTRIHSPIEGRIGISKARVGEFVGRSPNPVVLNYVSRTDPIRVRFAIDERRYLQLARRIRANEAAGESRQAVLELVLADGTLHPHTGHTVAADAAVDPETGTFTLEADFPNPEELVLAGQFARIRTAVETLEDALLVPQRCISELQGIFRVYVVAKDGSIEVRPVELGPRIDRLQVVLSGLMPEERVALDTMRLRPGLTVSPKLTALDSSGAVLERPDSETPADDEAGT